MEHMAWKGRIKPGCKAEYQRRHAEIWPEMVKVLKDAGICNYSIFYCNDELFGYYECEKGVAYAEKVQAESPVVDRWNDYMRTFWSWRWTPSPVPSPSWSRCSGWIEKGQNIDMQAKAPAAYGSGGFCPVRQFTARRPSGHCRSSAHRRRMPAPDPDPSPESSHG